MRVTINLATRPFIELRPLFLRLRIAMAALVLVAVGLGVWSHVLQKRLDRAAAQMNLLRYQTSAAQNERLHSEARMRQPANAAVLDRAHFLNALFLRKSFSWTAVMMDLETVLPSGVQVASIEPQPTPEGDVIIRLRVMGQRDRAIQLVRNLEHSRRFLQPRLSGESTQARDEGMQRSGRSAPEAPAGVAFDILANYNPLPAGEPYAHASSSAHAAAHKTKAIAAARSSHGNSSRGGLSHGGPSRYGVVLKPYGERPVGAPPPHGPVQGGPR